MKTLSDIKKIAVLGAGTMGPGIAQTYAMGGYQVTMWTRSESTREKAIASLKSQLHTFEEEGLLSESIDTIFNRVNFALTVEEAVAGADFIQETIVEKKDAKEELYAMMEDKYTELKESGKSEHEAIGTVIAEFGSLDEVIEDLHLREQPEQEPETAAEGFGASEEFSGYTERADEPNDEPDSRDGSFDYQSFSARLVSTEEAENFLQASRQAATRVAFGVMLCIFSPVVLIYMSGLSEATNGVLHENIAALIGLVVLFACIAAAVALFISSGVHTPQYQYLKEQSYQMSQETFSYIKELNDQFHSGFTAQIAVGVCLCILSVIPIIAAGLIFADMPRFLIVVIICVCLLFVLVGIGVFLLVHAGMIAESFKTLLNGDLYITEEHLWQTERRYNEPQSQRQNRRQKALSEAFSNIYWLCVTAAYLIWSFRFHAWGISWILWPLAGILWGSLESIMKAIRFK